VRHPAVVCTVRNTRHLCRFTGTDVIMAIKLDILNFSSIVFDGRHQLSITCD
jgi:hypothetical protein